MFINIKNLFVVSFCLLFFSIELNAQFKPGGLSNGIMPDVTPPSPEASSLGKYGEWPVSQYTGTPGISIPIYTIQANGLDLPIQLSYHAGGVKIDDVSAWVGANWSLSAGGVITRTVVGTPDENINGFLYRNTRGLTLKSSYDLTTAADYAFMMDVVNMQMDVEPDIFYYNFAGFSGKFYFDKDGNFQSIPVNNLKILRSPISTHSSSADKHWEIADQNGNIYFFGSYQDGGNGYEDTRTYTVGTPVAPKTTGWYLTKIKMFNSIEDINFEYVTKSETYDFPLINSYRTLTNIIDAEPPVSTTWSNILNLDKILTNGTNVNIEPTSFAASGKSMLSKIKWRHGELVFNAQTSRQDISGKMLNEIIVKNNSGEQIKKIVLSYSYLNGRYYLISVCENGSTSNTRCHNFEYNNPGSLPVRGSNLSYAQDHWGFYNGAVSNDHLLPATTEFNNPALDANREPNPTYAVYGTLNKIIYPTGGYSTFSYEGNLYDPASNLSGAPGSGIIPVSVNVSSSSSQPVTFSIPFAQNTSSIHIEFKDYAKPTSKDEAWLPLIKIEKLVGSIYEQVFYWDAFDNFPTGNVIPNEHGLIDITINTNVSLSTGQYRIVSSLVCEDNNCGSPTYMPSATAQLSYSTYNGQLPMAGGLRVRQIDNYDNAILTSRKIFSYAPAKLLMYPKYIFQYGENVYPKSRCFSEPECTPLLCWTTFAKYKEITSSSLSVLGVTQGAIVGYNYVKEENVTTGGDNNGFTEYNFTFAPDILNELDYDHSYWSGIDILNPTFPVNDMEYKRGLLASKNVYKKTKNGDFYKLYSLNNTYNYNENSIANRYNALRAMRIKRLRIVNYPCGTVYGGYTFPPGGAEPDFAYAFYDIITSWVQLSSFSEQFFDEKGSNPVTKTTAYSYSNPNHLLATEVTVTDSKGIIKTTNKYPLDYTISGTATNNAAKGIKFLQDNNIITPPVEQYVKRTNADGTNPRTVAAILNTFKPTAPYPDVSYTWESSSIATNFTPAVITASSFTKDSRYQPQVYFDVYDTEGKILQRHKTYDINQSYIWDYQSTYPIAEVKNAAQSAIAHTSFEAEGTGNWTIASTSRQNNDGVTGIKCYQLANGNITKSSLAAGKYIVSYWSKNTSSLTINGTSGTKGRTVNSWNYYEHQLTLAANATVTVSGAGLIDELRLYPADAQMTTYTYEPLVGMTSQCDISSKIIYYEYDDFQRLKLVRDQDKNILKKICYNYAGQPDACAENTPVPIDITLTTFFPTGTVPSPIKAEFMQGGVVKAMFNFPGTSGGSTTVNIPSGTYQVRFTVAAAHANTFVSYSITPGGFLTDKPNGSTTVTTGDINFNNTTNYTITASNAM